MQVAPGCESKPRGSHCRAGREELHRKLALFELCLKSLLRIVFGQGGFLYVPPRHELWDHLR
jgi:hypothetical protein